MTLTKVKICGIQEPAEALAAAGAGVDFVGLVFVPGRRRRLDEKKAASIVSDLRAEMATPPKTVGLFADQPAEEVNRTVKRCGLDMVQLCGGESLDFAAKVEAPVIKVVHVEDSLAVHDSVARLSQEVGAITERGHFVTLDRNVKGAQGGTGLSFNWDIANGLSQEGFSFLLAGGLTPENVAQAIQRVDPWGVDVSSGVETRGVKDGEKIRSFIRNARAASLAHRPMSG